MLLKILKFIFECIQILKILNYKLCGTILDFITSLAKYRKLYVRDQESLVLFSPISSAAIRTTKMRRNTHR